MAQPSSIPKRTLIGGSVLITTVTIVLLGTFLVVRTPQAALPSAPAAPQTQVLPTLIPLEEISTLLRRQDFGTWEYRALRNNLTGLKIVIDYKHDTASEIQSYVLAAERLIPDVVQAGGRAEVAISFLPPLSPEQFRLWATQNGLQVKQAQLAVGAPGSSGGTLLIGGSTEDPLPQDSIKNFAYNGMGGVFGVYGSIEASQLNAVANDPLVFLADVTPAWTRLDALRAGILDAQGAEIHLSLPYGFMERLNMVPTPSVVPGPVRTVEPLRLPTAPNWP